MFESGIVKLSFGDSLWRNFSALEYHYCTQPLPTPFAWYFHHAPRWFQRISCALVYLVEIALPFLIFAPQELRYVACGGFVLLMFLIFLTGNYTFFNLLTVVLSFLLLDDSFWREVLPTSLVQYPAQPLGFAAQRISAVAIHGWEFALTALVAIVSIPQVIQAIAPSVVVSKFWRLIQHGLQPFMIINSYGLFRAMTTKRMEIVIEGSENGVEWKEYEFRYKAGNLARRPPFVQPHQPRLDWQMWFAALSYYQMTPWFEPLLIRLMDNAPEVVALLKEAPFEGPHFIRAMLYEYTFTTAEEKRRTGAWWRRELIGAYSPVLIRRTPKETLAEALDSETAPTQKPS
jgi:hypothetical protein